MCRLPPAFRLTCVWSLRPFVDLAEGAEGLFNTEDHDTHTKKDSAARRRASNPHRAILMLPPRVHLALPVEAALGLARVGF